MDLVTFLLERIAEDEAAVNERTRRMAPDGCELLEQFGDFDERWMIEMPAGRLTAQCEAVRSIISQYLEAERATDHAATNGTTDAWSGGMAYAGELAVRALASAYRDHPDYRTEWHTETPNPLP